MVRLQFTERVIAIIREIPEGMVATYGGIAELAGNRRAARQVSRILHSCSKKESLPWHRVVNREGIIALPSDIQREKQRSLLKDEGVGFICSNKVDLSIHLWQPF